jgi:ABC-type lipoprotein export system ATPase subunit
MSARSPRRARWCTCRFEGREGLLQILELEEVHKHYRSAGGEVRAVNGVTLAIAKGETVAILGPSGSGKTTLLLLAAGLLLAEAGAVRFKGRDLGTLSKQEVLRYRRTELGFVFQNFNLIPGLSAEENVALPLLLRGTHRSEARVRAREALASVALSGRAGHAPERLSGGECQRVAIARALVGGPSLVLADEPTGNLDTESGDEVLRCLAISSGSTECRCCLSRTTCAWRLARTAPW